jgi:hypothetical protein
LIAWGIVVGRPAAAYAQTVPSSASPVLTTADISLYIDPNVDLTGQPAVSVVSNVPTISNQGTIVSAGNAINEGVNTNLTIGKLLNAAGATIAGTSAVINYGVIHTLTNNGIVTGTTTIGVDNQYSGSIGVVSNTNTISGASIGLYNYNQIDMITNTGTIHAATIAGIQNASSASGVSKSVTIGVLTNSGVISGSGAVRAVQGFGIQNGATGGSTGLAIITSLNNLAAGTIVGNETGLYNGATISTLTNAGLITGTIY